MKKLLLLASLICILFSNDALCQKRKKKRKKSKSSIRQRTKAKTSKPSLLVVSFISIGSGIDYKQIPVFENDIKEFNKKDTCKLTYSTKNWGREGERDYCLSFKDSICMKNYLSTAADKFKDNERILFKENAECRK
jgi:predicted RND superfamily exporter protein